MTDRYLTSVDGNDADDGSTRALADATFTAALAAMSAGDRLFISHAHSESFAAGQTFTTVGTAAAPVQIISANFAGTADPSPPVSADLTQGATWTTTTSSDPITINGYGYFYGLKINPATGTVAGGFVTLASAGAGADQVYENCDIGAAGTGSTCSIQVGGQSSTLAGNSVHFKNCQLRFNNVNNSIILRSGRVLIDSGTTIVGSAVPTTLVTLATDGAGSLVMRGVPLTAFTSGNNLVDVSTDVPATVQFVECRLGAGVAAITGTATGSGGTRVELYGCDSGDTTYRNEVWHNLSNLITVTDLVRSGGYTDRGTAVAWKMTSGANANFLVPFESFPIEVYFDSTGSKTLTLHYIHGQSAALKNNEIYAKVSYLGTSGFPLSSIATDAAADVLAAGANQDADTAADWDDGLTARANSTAYSVNDIRRAATPNGRAFICTGAGTSAGSEPAEFGTANDGDSVTDNTATWRCMRREKLEVTFTVNEVGRAIIWVELAKASIPVWVCPEAEGGAAAPQFFMSPGGGLTSFAAAAGGGSGGAHIMGGTVVR